MSARVVVLGTGFAGLAVARATAPAARRPRHRRGQPRELRALHADAARGGERVDRAAPHRRAVPQRRARTRPSCWARSHGVDFAARTVATRHPVTGETTAARLRPARHRAGRGQSTHGIPGADDHTFGAQDARRRDPPARPADPLARGGGGDAATTAERRALLTVAVVGGGFTGVEAAGELLAYLRRAAREYRGPRRRRCCASCWSPAAAGSSSSFPRGSAARAQAMLAARGVEIVLGDEVAAVDARRPHAQVGRASRVQDRRVERRRARSRAGRATGPPARRAPRDRGEPGLLGARADPGVWALGDCASVPKPGGGAYPQTAQDAVREGALLARNVDAALRGRRDAAVPLSRRWA